MKILSILGRDGRATMTDIAAELNLSLSACHRRFRDFEAVRAAGFPAAYRGGV
ncbi:winged helix-turn-helix domain-containing protein [Corynebacterium stationis]|uniref:winged helix-turn-helix domain-containing protein n=1 Tax=Corynebacterium stationis TaxID=1705 RepID=UPI00339C64FB